jgi:hypothetical protein
MLESLSLVDYLTTVTQEEQEKEKKHYVLLDGIQQLIYAEVDDFKIYYYNIFTHIYYYHNNYTSIPRSSRCIASI